jgi:hypothetical protein
VEIKRNIKNPALLKFAGFLNNIMRLIVPTIIFIHVFSCVNREVVDLSSLYEKKPVVFSIISPHNPAIDVWVSRTYAYNEETIFDSLEETNAIVKIHGNELSVILPFDSFKRLYSISQEEFQLIEGETYLIEVILSTGETCTSETTIPNCVVRIDSSTIERKGPFQVDEYENYSEIIFSIRAFSPLLNSELYDYYLDEFDLKNSNTDDAVIPYSGSGYYEKEIDGKHAFTFDCHYAFPEYELREIKDSFPIGLYVANKSYGEGRENYIKIHKILNPQLDFSTFSGVFPKWSNIKDGYGYFGSYIKSKPYYLNFN